MEADLGFGFLFFHGILPPELLSLRSGLDPCRDYSVRRCRLVFPYLIYSQSESSAACLFVLTAYY